MDAIVEPRNKGRLVSLIKEALDTTTYLRQESLNQLPTEVTHFLPDLIESMPHAKAIFMRGGGDQYAQLPREDKIKSHDIFNRVNREMQRIIFDSPLVNVLCGGGSFDGQPVTRKEVLSRIAIEKLITDNILSRSIGHDFSHLLFESFRPVATRVAPDHAMIRNSSGKVVGAHSTICLEKALEAWPENARNAMHLLDFPFKQIYNLLGYPTETLTLDQITSYVRGALHNRFFGLVQEGKVRMDVSPNTLVIPGEISGLITGFLYNLAKNSFKRAQELDEERKHMADHSIFVTSSYANGKTHLAVGQTFEGIDFYKYALLGFNLVKDGKMPTSVNQATVRRYQEWISSINGTGFGNLTVADVTDLVFMAHVSGAELKSPTSGIGLYALRELSARMGAKVEYFFRPQEHNPKAGIAGFVLSY